MLRRSKTDKNSSAQVVEGAHILVVCDQPDAAELLVRVLEHHQFTTAQAADVDEALASVRAGEPPVDLAFVDFRSGGTSLGLKLLDQIRDDEDDQIAHTRVILTTDLDENRMFSWQSGADGFLVRPYRSDILTDAISSTLARTTDERVAYRKDQMRDVAHHGHPRAADG